MLLANFSYKTECFDILCCFAVGFHYSYTDVSIIVYDFLYKLLFYIMVCTGSVRVVNAQATFLCGGHSGTDQAIPFSSTR